MKQSVRERLKHRTHERDTYYNRCNDLVKLLTAMEEYDREMFKTLSDGAMKVLGIEESEPL